MCILLMICRWLHHHRLRHFLTHCIQPENDMPIKLFTSSLSLSLKHEILNTAGHYVLYQRNHKCTSCVCLFGFVALDFQIEIRYKQPFPCKLAHTVIIIHICNRSKCQRKRNQHLPDTKLTYSTISLWYSCWPPL